VRRLVAPASSLTNHERTNVVRRLLVGLRAAGVGLVWYMPDRHQLIARAASSVPELKVRPALEAVTDTPDDTLAATEAMVAAGVRVLVTHGGDGTNRLVALRAQAVPILPIAAGTNNVFPGAAEPTAAGFAAGVLARGGAPDDCVRRHKRIRVQVGHHEDVALVDAAIVRDQSIGGRAVWDPERVVACLVTRAAPGSVGLTGLAGALVSIGPTEPVGAFVEMGPGMAIVALIAPGRVVHTEVRKVRRIETGECVEVGPLSGAVTLDGERQLLVRDQQVRLTLEADGPLVVDVPATLTWAQRIGAFRQPREPSGSPSAC
jgi:predicted polyphosphate/ATP-dependent NAD kinase